MLFKEIKYFLQTLLFILDVIMLNAILLSLLYLLGENTVVHEVIFLNSHLIYLNLFWIMLASFLGQYNSKIILRFEMLIKRTVQVFVVWMLFDLGYLLSVKHIYSNSLSIFIFYFCFLTGLFLNRFIFFGLKGYIRYQKMLGNKILILGYNETAKKIACYFEEEGVNTQLMGFIENQHNVKELTHYPVLCGIKKTIQYAEKYGADEIISTITPEQNHYVYSLIQNAEDRCIRFKIVPDLSYFIRQPVVIDNIRDMPVLSLRTDPLEDLGNKMKKRVLDLSVSILVTVLLLSWMIPLLGLIIKIESKGPILFAQIRTGRNNKPFYCLKFRSMYINPDQDIKSATKGDPRVSWIGGFLRKTSLDEFPQFLNVLVGDMSLVGPRPHMLQHTTEFSRLVDHYMIRQFLKPGITGWAQVNGYRGEIKDPIQIKRRVASDLWYMENWTIWLDMRILFLTFYKVMTGDKQAY